MVYEISQTASVLPGQPLIRAVGTDSSQKIWSKTTKAAAEFYEAFFIKSRITWLRCPVE